jgi:hypothetical protein
MAAISSGEFVPKPNSTIALLPGQSHSTSVDHTTTPLLIESRELSGREHLSHNLLVLGLHLNNELRSPILFAR